MKAAEIRRRYIQWFVDRGHVHLPSDSLVPSHDPTLLFTGAGMNQFKDMFLGKGDLPYKRVTTVQKCLRVPDLEKVGRTPRHHTFFEMLGNFSFGDYFKEECLTWILGFFIEELGLPRDRLVGTVYVDDDEAFRIWTEVLGFPEERVYRFGEKENFWPAEAPSKGPDGPCGPCSEVYFDLEPGGPLPPKEGLTALPERFVEIGNCVFTQFDRRPGGELAPLAQKNIDVGLGLERIAAVVQGVPTNFDTELFLPLIEDLAGRAGRRYGEEPAADARLRRIADHARALAFCIADGILRGNEGRGYVVRKILRRACRDGWRLGLATPFLAGACGIVVETMGDDWPELRDARGQILAVADEEEKTFRQVYEHGSARLRRWIADLSPRPQWPQREVEGRGPLPVPPDSGAVAFELHDTHGFPRDVTRELLAEAGFALDEEGFERAMAEQRERARRASNLAGAVFTEGLATRLKERGVPKTEFIGYESDEGEGLCLVLARGDEEVERLAPGHPAGAVAVFDRTPFYAEAGGQVGDRGWIEWEGGRAQVADVQRLHGFHLHEITVEEGEMVPGARYRLRVDAELRRATERNHTATHLLHQALKQVLGPHVAQAGSLVAPDRLRFDFTHPKKPTARELQAVEDLVNEQIRAALEVRPVEMPLEEARRRGFVALFGEKYGETVRTLSVGAFSRELCGGTHVRNSGNIGVFRILQETSVAAGIRRIEAVTGPAALEAARRDRGLLEELARRLKTAPAEVPARVEALQAELRELKKRLREKERGRVADAFEDLCGRVEERDGLKVLAAVVEGADQAALLDLCDRLKKRFRAFAGLLLGPGADGVAVVAVASKEAVARGADAGRVAREAARLLGGGGGGRPELGRGKGNDRSKLEAALDLGRKLCGGARAGR